MKYSIFAKFALLASLAFAFGSTVDAQATRTVDFDLTNPRVFDANVGMQVPQNQELQDALDEGIGAEVSIGGVTLTVLDIGADGFVEIPQTGQEQEVMPTGEVAAGSLLVGTSGLSITNTSLNNNLGNPDIGLARAAYGTSDSGFINAGEFLSFEFDTDVQFTLLDLNQLSGDENLNIEIGDTVFTFDANEPSDDFFDPFGADFLIDAGTAITITGAPSGEQNLAFQLTSFSVEVAAVPEPSSVALLGLGGVLTIARRRRS